MHARMIRIHTGEKTTLLTPDLRRVDETEFKRRMREAWVTRQRTIQPFKHGVFENQPTDPAFMGFNAAGHVRVCAWCAGAHTVRTWAELRNLRVTDGICPTHQAQMLQSAKISMD